MEVIHIKIEKKTEEQVDRLVRTGVYKNKSEAVRRMLEEHIAEHPELLVGEELKKLMEHADSVSDEEFRERLAQGLKGSKSVAQRLAEERDRFT